MAYSSTKEINNGCFSVFAVISIALTIGTLLCLTGIGAILGIPIIIAGFIFPFTKSGNSPTLKGKCPYCGYDVYASKNAPGVTCKACKQRIIIKDGVFYTLK